MFRSLTGGAIGVSVPFPEEVALAAEFGFQGVSLRLDYLEEKGVQATRDLLETHRVLPSLLGLPVNFREGDAEFEATLALLPGQAEKTAELGVTRCSTWVLPGKKALSDQEYFAELNHRLGECARVLHDYGIRLGFEFIGPKTLRDQLGLSTPGLSTAEAMLELVDAIGIPGTGLLLDSWHWYTSHGDDSVFDQLTNGLVVDVHVNDAPLGKNIDDQLDHQRELPGATRVIDLEAFFGGLRKIGYDGPVTVEPFNADLSALGDREAVRTTAEALKKFV